MVSIPIGTDEYSRKAAGNPELSIRNGYLEEDPTNQETQQTVIRRPGIRQLLRVGTGPIRKIFYRPDTFDNDFFVVSGTQLYRVKRVGANDFASTLIPGTLVDTNEIVITSSGDKLFISDGTAFYWTNGVDLLTPIATPDGVIFDNLGYISGYIICVIMNSQRFYWIRPGEITIDALDFAEAEGLPDGIVDLLILGDQMYLFGKETIETWYLTGDDAAPFQRLQGKLMNVGVIAGTAALVSSNDTIFFIAADGTVRVGASAQKISNPGIEEKIRRALTNKRLAEA